MDAELWTQFRSQHEAAFVDTLVEAGDCGPFDGGCLPVALFLHSLLGGTIVVLVRADGLADHAAVEVGGQLWDFDGPASGPDMIARFNDNEMAHCVGHRAMVPGDLVASNALAHVADILEERFGELLRASRPIAFG